MGERLNLKEEVQFLIATVQKKFHRELNYFYVNYCKMGDKLKREYLEFLEKLKQWVQQEYKVAAADTPLVQTFVSKINYILL